MRAAGFGTWLVALLPTTVAFLRSELAGPRALGFAIGAITFLAAYSAACRARTGLRNAPLAALAAQSLAAVAMVWFGRGVVTAAIFVVVASQLPGVVSGGVATAWVALQSATIAVRFDALHTGPALASCGGFAGFQAFALAAASGAASERRAGAVAAAHSRTIERLRVARDLHDTLGHHLTALGMQLEVAARLTDGRAKEHIERAHAIGRSLLTGVRDAVSDLRGSASARRGLCGDPGRRARQGRGRVRPRSRRHVALTGSAASWSRRDHPLRARGADERRAPCRRTKPMDRDHRRPLGDPPARAR